MVFVPDFKLCLPGGCNAKCSFCFQKQIPTKNENWITHLKNKLEEATEQFPQLNITGGEPTISPFYKETLEVIKSFRHKFTKVVMTTNGTKLVPEDLNGIVDYINISRHHYNNEKNSKIFQTDQVPTYPKLKDLIKRCKKNGVLPTFSLTITEDFSKKYDVENMVQFCREMDVWSLFLRNDYHKGAVPSDLESEFSDDMTWIESKCPTCRVKIQNICGITTYWISGVVEPYTGENAREVILQPTGELSFDYAGKHHADFKTLKIDTMLNDSFFPVDSHSTNSLRINLGKVSQNKEFGEEQYEKDLIKIEEALEEYIKKHGPINVMCAENHGMYKLPPPEKLRELTEKENEICKNRREDLTEKIQFDYLFSPDKYKKYDENNIPERGIRRVK